MDEMLCMKELFSPSMAVPMSVTVTMPMTMPSVVRMERILFARMALHEMVKPSRSSVKKFIPDNHFVTASSLAMRPSRMRMTRCACRATSSSWVTTIMVFPMSARC